MNQNETWNVGGRHWPRSHYVTWGPSSRQKVHSPQFLADVSCGQTAGWIKMPLGMEVASALATVLDGDPASPSQKRGTALQLSAHVYFGQAAGCISIPHGTEVGLGPGDIVLSGDSAPLLKRAQPPPQFSAYVYCGQTAGWIKMPLGTEVGLPIFGPYLLWTNGLRSQLLLSSCSKWRRSPSCTFKDWNL